VMSKLIGQGKSGKGPGDAASALRGLSISRGWTRKPAQRSNRGDRVRKSINIIFHIIFVCASSPIMVAAMVFIFWRSGGSFCSWKASVCAGLCVCNTTIK
jgi:hypothetical protein